MPMMNVDMNPMKLDRIINIHLKYLANDRKA